MSRHTITSITIHPIRLAMIQVIMSVLTFITATMQYISTCTIIFKIFVVCSLKWKLYFTMTNATHVVVYEIKVTISSLHSHHNWFTFCLRLASGGQLWIHLFSRLASGGQFWDPKTLQGSWFQIILSSQKYFIKLIS